MNIFVLEIWDHKALILGFMLENRMLLLQMKPTYSLKSAAGVKIKE